MNTYNKKRRELVERALIMLIKEGGCQIAHTFIERGQERDIYYAR